MINYVYGDFFTVQAKYKAHGCNCFCTFGSGLALDVKRKWPEVYAADLKTASGEKSKLGAYSTAILPDKTVVFNAYTQYTISNSERVCSYDAIIQCFESIKDTILSDLDEDETMDFPPNLAVPYLYNCGKAGGDWGIVEAIFKSLFADCTEINLMIVIGKGNLDHYLKYKRID